MAVAGRDFWSQFLNILEEGRPEQSDPGYYLPNQGGGAQAGEYANVIEVIFKRTQPGSAERVELVDLLAEAGFWAPGDDLDFWKNQEVNELDVNDLANAAESRMPQMFDASGKSVNIGAQGGAGGAGGAAGVPGGIMSGFTLTKISGLGQDDIWGLTANINGIQHVYTFDSEEAMKQALGDDAITSGKYGFQTLSQDTLNDGDTWVLGDAAAFVGQTGNYNSWFNNTMNEAALEAGVRNPGLVGRYLQDPEVQRIIAEGEAGNWSDDRIQAELRRSDFYNNTLYPGISNFLDSGQYGDNPEGAYLQYMRDVSPALESLGYEKDADGTFRGAMKEMLDAGIEADEFNQFAPTFIRAEQSQDFAESLNFWVQQDMGRDLTFEDWVDVLEGTSTAELGQTVERAQLQFQANQQLSSALDPEQIRRISEMTDMTEQQIATAFGGAEQQLLALGDRGLARYNLNERQLVNAAFGISTEGSDFTPEQVSRTARKTILELGLSDDPKAQFFTSFDRFSRPVREGLAAAAPEVG